MPSSPDGAGDDRSEGGAQHEGGPGRTLDVPVDAGQAIGIVGQEGPEGRDGGEHRGADETEKEGRHHQCGKCVGEDHPQRHRDEHDLGSNEDTAWVETIDQHPGHRRADQGGDAEGSHDGSHARSRGVQLERRLAPDADEEGRFSPAAGDEPSQDNPSDITICPHDV